MLSSTIKKWGRRLLRIYNFRFGGETLLTSLRNAAVVAVAVLIITIGAWDLARPAALSPQRTAELVRPHRRAVATGAFTYSACLESELRQRVPHDARVVVISKDDASYQRLTEIATPWTQLTTDAKAAQYSIAFVAAPPGGGCGGTLVVVRPA